MELINKVVQSINNKSFDQLFILHEQIKENRDKFERTIIQSLYMTCNYKDMILIITEIHDIFTIPIYRQFIELYIALYNKDLVTSHKIIQEFGSELRHCDEIAGYIYDNRKDPEITKLLSLLKQWFFVDTTCFHHDDNYLCCNNKLIPIDDANEDEDYKLKILPIHYYRFSYTKTPVIDDNLKAYYKYVEELDNALDIFANRLEAEVYQYQPGIGAFGEFQYSNMGLQITTGVETKQFIKNLKLNKQDFLDKYEKRIDVEKAIMLSLIKKSSDPSSIKNQFYSMLMLYHLYIDIEQIHGLEIKLEPKDDYYTHYDIDSLRNTSGDYQMQITTFKHCQSYYPNYKESPLITFTDLLFHNLTIEKQNMIVEYKNESDYTNQITNIKNWPTEVIDFILTRDRHRMCIDDYLEELNSEFCIVRSEKCTKMFNHLSKLISIENKNQLDDFEKCGFKITDGKITGYLDIYKNYPPFLFSNFGKEKHQMALFDSDLIKGSDGDYVSQFKCKTFKPFMDKTYEEYSVVIEAEINDCIIISEYEPLKEKYTDQILPSKYIVKEIIKHHNKQEITYKTKLDMVNSDVMNNPNSRFLLAVSIIQNGNREHELKQISEKLNQEEMDILIYHVDAIGYFYNLNGKPKMKIPENIKCATNLLKKLDEFELSIIATYYANFKMNFTFEEFRLLHGFIDPRNREQFENSYLISVMDGCFGENINIFQILNCHKLDLPKKQMYYIGDNSLILNFIDNLDLLMKFNHIMDSFNNDEKQDLIAYKLTVDNRDIDYPEIKYYPGLKVFLRINQPNDDDKFYHMQSGKTDPFDYIGKYENDNGYSVLLWNENIMLDIIKRIVPYNTIANIQLMTCKIPKEQLCVVINEGMVITSYFEVMDITSFRDIEKNC